MSVRTYNPSVRVGNWNEDIQLEEDTLKDFLERRENGQLLIQKTTSLKNAILNPIEISVSRTGKVHFGDTVVIVNPCCGDRRSVALAANMSDPDKCGATGCVDTTPSAKTALCITSMDGTPRGEPLCYGQPFYICTANGNLFLYSDRASFVNAAKKSRHNEVKFVEQPSHLTEWKVLPFNPKFRMELEFSPVPVNEKVIITHVKTNQNLCLEATCMIRTVFGQEFEVTSHTVLDSHKAETDVNHWMFVSRQPDDQPQKQCMD